MPELPEVETTLRGIAPHIVEQAITKVIIHCDKLRWPITANIKHELTNQRILQVQRRGKYLLFTLTNGTLIMHLGMSGNLRIITHSLPRRQHDHFEILFFNKKIMRFNDPRRFGAIIWTTNDPFLHPLLANLGVEPLTRSLTGNYLWQLAKKRNIAVKSFIMNNNIIVGVGNIYAAEALFAAGIYPLTPANTITLDQYQRLVVALKFILRKAIQAGGTTLKDFVNSDGKPGYFISQLKVYGRAGLPCLHCKASLKESRLMGRSTVYCSFCQI